MRFKLADPSQQVAFEVPDCVLADAEHLRKQLQAEVERATRAMMEALDAAFVEWLFADGPRQDRDFMPKFTHEGHELPQCPGVAGWRVRAKDFMPVIHDL